MDEQLSTNISVCTHEKGNRSYVFIKDKKYGWVQAELLKTNGDFATVIRKLPEKSKQISFDNDGVALFPDVDFKVGDNDRDLSNDDESIIQKNVQIVMDPSLMNSGPATRSMPSDSSTSIMSSCMDTQTFFGDNIEITINTKEYPSGNLPLQCVEDDGSPIQYEDMSKMPYLHEASILYNLKSRYDGEDGVPYTRAGDILIAVNPYRWIKGLYAEDCRFLYADNLVWRGNPTALQELPPHLYETSSLAFKGLIFDGKNQSILVSGESGAGKTVSVKVLMSHLATFHELKKAYKTRRLGDSESQPEEECTSPVDGIIQWLSKSFLGKFLKFSVRGPMVEFDIEAPDEPDDEPDEMNQTNLIVQRVLDSNPLLEAFGNAKTPRNDNSSRFSKFVKLQFHIEFLGKAQPSCNIAGSFCHTYLLEKSRVTHNHSQTDERNFHIFYQLLAAPEPFKQKVWEALSGKNTSDFKYIGFSRTKTIEGLTDEQRWRRTMAALHTIGIKGETLYSLFRALCAVVQLGNLIFDVDPSNEEGCIISNQLDLNQLSHITGIPSDDLTRALTFRTVNAVHDTYDVPLNLRAGKEVCDSFAKEIYARLFDWLVQSINDATCATKNYQLASKVEEYHSIGLLDIFGFECFDTNLFEQLCINHANERLQQKFTKDFFKSVKEEYRHEGISLRDIKYHDNQDVLDMIEGKMGLIDLLNEECLRPRGSDAGFVNKLYANHQATSTSVLMFDRKYHLSPCLFGIRHYAGSVEYDATNFLVKNGDTLASDVVNAALKSTNDLIKNSFLVLKDEKPKRKGALVTSTVWTKFRTQLNSLMKDLNQTKTRYVRCINPNTKRIPGLFDLQYSLTQLQYAGLVSAIAMSRASFPNKMTFQDVMDRFWFLADFDSLKFMKLTHSERKLNEKTKTIWRMISFDKKDDRTSIQKTQELLGHLLKPLDLNPDNESNVKHFVCGKTMVYFRSGVLEYLESERLKAYDRCATVIQCMARKKSARVVFEDLFKHPRPKQQDMTLSALLRKETNVFFFPFLFFKYLWLSRTHLFRGN